VLTDLESIRWLLPEALLIAVATLIIVAGAFRRAPLAWLFTSLCGYTLAAVLVASETTTWVSNADVILSGPLVNDPLGVVLRLLAVLAGAIFSLISSRNLKHRLSSEIQGLLMILTAGAMVAARANELAFLLLGLELISIPTYVLLFLGRRDRASGEASAKYFYLSIMSSALLLYGFSFVYGAAGTTWLTSDGSTASVRAALGDNPSIYASFGLALVIAGLGFKIAAAPFHFYAPDVYEGTTHANAAVLAIAPKLAGMAAFIRLVVIAMGGLHDFAWQAALVVAAITMTIGNACALWQNNVRRLMAYSSIAHAGYMLIGITVAAAAPLGSGSRTLAFGGVASTTFYLCVYTLAAAGIFAALAYLSEDDRQLDSVDQLAGLVSSHPVIAAAIAVFMFSLAGIPPLAGFWGKLTLFTSAISLVIADENGAVAPWIAGLAVVGVLNAAIAAAYYLRIIAVMYFRPAVARPLRAGGPSAAVAVAICAVLVILVGIRSAPLASWTTFSEQLLLPASSSNAPLQTTSAEASAAIRIAEVPGRAE
jgi:NADH-quinone oxidoreductase subunit N